MWKYKREKLKKDGWIFTIVEPQISLSLDNAFQANLRAKLWINLHIFLSTTFCVLTSSHNHLLRHSFSLLDPLQYKRLYETWSTQPWPLFCYILTRFPCYWKVTIHDTCLHDLCPYKLTIKNHRRWNLLTFCVCLSGSFMALLCTSFGLILWLTKMHDVSHAINLLRAKKLVFRKVFFQLHQMNSFFPK